MWSVQETEQLLLGATCLGPRPVSLAPSLCHTSPDESSSKHSNTLFVVGVVGADPDSVVFQGIDIAGPGSTFFSIMVDFGEWGCLLSQWFSASPCWCLLVPGCVCGGRQPAPLVAQVGLDFRHVGEEWRCHVVLGASGTGTLGP